MSKNQDVILDRFKQAAGVKQTPEPDSEQGKLWMARLDFLKGKFLESEVSELKIASNGNPDASIIRAGGRSKTIYYMIDGKDISSTKESDLIFASFLSQNERSAEKSLIESLGNLIPKEQLIYPRDLRKDSFPSRESVEDEFDPSYDTGESGSIDDIEEDEKDFDKVGDVDPNTGELGASKNPDDDYVPPVPDDLNAMFIRLENDQYKAAYNTSFELYQQFLLSGKESVSVNKDGVEYGLRLLPSEDNRKFVEFRVGNATGNAEINTTAWKVFGAEVNSAGVKESLLEAIGVKNRSEEKEAESKTPSEPDEAKSNPKENSVNPDDTDHKDTGHRDTVHTSKEPGAGESDENRDEASEKTDSGNGDHKGKSEAKGFPFENEEEQAEYEEALRKRHMHSKDAADEIIDGIGKIFENRDDTARFNIGGKNVTIRRDAGKIINDELPGVIVRIDGIQVTRKELESFIEANKEEFVEQMNKEIDRIVYQEKQKEFHSRERKEKFKEPLRKAGHAMKQGMSKAAGGMKTVGGFTGKMYRKAVDKEAIYEGKNLVYAARGPVFNNPGAFSEFTVGGHLVRAEASTYEKDDQVNPTVKWTIDGKEVGGKDPEHSAKFSELYMLAYENKVDFAKNLKENTVTPGGMDDVGGSKGEKGDNDKTDKDNGGDKGKAINKDNGPER